jgi:hypothetical protein
MQQRPRTFSRTRPATPGPSLPVVDDGLDDDEDEGDEPLPEVGTDVADTDESLIDDPEGTHWPRMHGHACPAFIISASLLSFPMPRVSGLDLKTSHI